METTTALIIAILSSGGGVALISKLLSYKRDKLHDSTDAVVVYQELISNQAKEITNVYQSNLALQKEIAELTKRISELEARIIQLQEVKQ